MSDYQMSKELLEDLGDTYRFYRQCYVGSGAYQSFSEEEIEGIANSIASDLQPSEFDDAVKNLKETLIQDYSAPELQKTLKKLAGLVNDLKVKKEREVIITGPERKNHDVNLNAPGNGCRTAVGVIPFEEDENEVYAGLVDNREENIGADEGGIEGEDIESEVEAKNGDWISRAKKSTWFRSP